MSAAQQVVNPLRQNPGEVSAVVFGGPEFSYGEVAAVICPGTGKYSGFQKAVITLPCSRDLTARKFYFSVNTNVAQQIGVEYFLAATARCYIGNTKVGELPLNFACGGIGPAVGYKKTSACMGVTANSGAVGQDALFVSYANLATWENTAGSLFNVLYPTHFKGVFDRMEIDIDGMFNVAFARMYAAIQSNTGQGG